MIVCDDPRFVFVSTPKAGTHTMYAALRRLYGCARPPRNGRRYHDRDVPPRCLQHCLFTVVRNPFTRALAAWYHLVHRWPYRDHWRPALPSASFPDFAARLPLWADRSVWPRLRGDVVLTPQAVWLRRFGTRIRALHLERLDAEFAALPFVEGRPRLGWQSSDGEDIKAHPYGNPRDWLTPETWEPIRIWAAEDFNRYGYRTDPSAGFEKA